MNVLSMTGNLGRDVSTNNVNGTAVANFVVAMKSGFGDNQQTVWVDCALWGKRAESGLIQYLTKGQQVAVSGEMGTREYQGNDGQTRTAVTCRVEQISLVGGSNQQQGQQQQQPQQQQQNYQQPQQQMQQPAQQPQNGGFDDSIPF